MTDHAIAISNPPHGIVEYEKAAPSFGLSPAEVRMKANYPIPEIWIAGEDVPLVKSAAKVLTNSGLNVTVSTGQDLLSVPIGTVAEAVEFTDSGVRVSCDGSTCEIPQDARIVAVFCSPQSRDIDRITHKADSLRSRMSHSTVIVGDRTHSSSLVNLLDRSGSIDEQIPFIDIYAEVDGTPNRFSLVVGTKISSEHEEEKSLTAREMPNLIKRISDMFADLHLDERLVGMRVRKRQMVGTVTPNESRRKGYSFASAGLTRLLEAISPKLRNIGDADFSSRLAFITSWYK